MLRRGHIYERLDKPHEAMQDFQEVIKLDKDNRDARAAVMVKFCLIFYSFGQKWSLFSHMLSVLKYFSKIERSKTNPQVKVMVVGLRSNGL